MLSPDAMLHHTPYPGRQFSSSSLATPSRGSTLNCAPPVARGRHSRHDPVAADLDPAGADGGRELRWSSAGHPPPVLLRRDGGAAELKGTPDLLLGFRSGAVRRDHTVVLYPGDVLVLYTDGLVERRRENLRAGLARLVATVETAAPGDPWALIEALAPSTIRRDDVAVLTVTLG